MIPLVNECLKETLHLLQRFQNTGGVVVLHVSKVSHASAVEHLGHSKQIDKRQFHSTCYCE